MPKGGRSSIHFSIHLGLLRSTSTNVYLGQVNLYFRLLWSAPFANVIIRTRKRVSTFVAPLRQSMLQAVVHTACRLSRAYSQQAMPLYEAVCDVVHGCRERRSGPLSMDCQVSSFARADNFAISMLSLLTACQPLLLPRYVHARSGTQFPHPAAEDPTALLLLERSPGTTLPDKKMILRAKSCSLRCRVNADVSTQNTRPDLIQDHPQRDGQARTNSTLNISYPQLPRACLEESTSQLVEYFESLWLPRFRARSTLEAKTCRRC
ncbi:hypothetical protein KCU90_g240, partial [Aureobasidium melanogenum]